MIVRSLMILLLLGNAFSLAAQSIAVKGATFGDSIRLRWAPADMATWEQGNTAGYVLIRHTYDETDQLLAMEVLDTLRLQPATAWLPLKDQNQVLGMAYTLLFEFNDDLNDPLDQFNVQENRYGFTLFAADMSFQAAQMMGLGYIDEHISQDYHYTYTVSLSTDTLAAQSGLTRIYPQEPSVLPVPEQVEVAFGNLTALLAWEKGELGQYYSAYVIEKSVAGGDFLPVSDIPFVQMESEDQTNIPEIFQRKIFFRDSLTQNGVEVQYRVRGLSPFGITGPLSATVSGMGRPDPIPASPVIREAAETMEQTVQIDWTINTAYQDSIQGFHVYRMESLEGTPQRLNPTLLPPDTRTFLDESPLPLGYYLVETIDQNEYSLPSTRAMVQLLDQEPPAVPDSLTAKVDEAGIVRLEWKANTEADLSGYLLYLGYSATGGNIPLNEGKEIKGTSYVDTVADYATSIKEIYYRIQAVDYRGNRSVQSAAAKIVRPDQEPPAPAVFKDWAFRTDSVFLQWAASPSTDLARQYIERRLDNDTSTWQLVHTDSVLLEVDSTLDIGLDMAGQYYYRIRSLDETGLEAISDSIYLQTGKRKPSPAITNFAITPVPEGNRISWRCPETKRPVYQFVIYRASGDQDMRMYKRLKPDNELLVNTEGSLDFRYLDELLEPGILYRYQMVVHFEDGTYSPFTEIIE